MGKYFIFHLIKNTKNVISKSPFCYFLLPAMQEIKISPRFH